MQTIHRYVTVSFLATLVLAFLVITFVLSVGILFKITGWLARGASGSLVLEMVLSGVPQSLGFSIPMSALVAVLLLFGRLSADSEISAMRACGVSLAQILSPFLLLAVALTLVCLYVHDELGPRSHLAQRSLRARIGATSAMDVLEEGRFVSLGDLSVYVGRRDGRIARDVRIYDLRNPNARREIRAESAVVGTNGASLVLDLRHVRLDPIPLKDGSLAVCDELRIEVPDVLRARSYTQRQSDMTFAELFDRIWCVAAWFPGLPAADLAQERMVFSVELNKRLVLAVSCLVFVFLGAPLGIKAHRRESSVGAAIGLLVVFLFYIFLLVAQSLARHPELRPDLILWVPVVLSLLFGAVLLHRAR
jgi:lipopolysaccharide export system permease protein